ncbi:hypothetical protein P7M25_25855, partial [Vibrio parahaemolyticus]|nr:hypothetical protein [Vibrio parahaemolyticus]
MSLDHWQSEEFTILNFEYPHGKPLISIVSSLGKQALGLEKEPLPDHDVDLRPSTVKENKDQ